MAIQTTLQKNNLATAYGNAAVSVALYTTAPGATAGTEVTGGTYARKTPSWGAAANGAVTATVVFDVPAGQTVRGAGVYNAGATYLDGGTLTDQAFASAGTYTLTLTYTQG